MRLALPRAQLQQLLEQMMRKPQPSRPLRVEHRWRTLLGSQITAFCRLSPCLGHHSTYDDIGSKDDCTWPTA